jgi:hypothetical protein
MDRQMFSFCRWYWSLGKSSENSTAEVTHASLTNSVSLQDGARTGRWPTPVSYYERNILRTVKNLQAFAPTAKIYLSNIIYLALKESKHIRFYMWWIGSFLTFALVFAGSWRLCPTKDWRNAALMDHYNAALRRVVSVMASDESLSSPPPEYLDSSFITKPMWDSPPDWGHFKNEAGRVQSVFIAAKVLGIV